MSDIYKVPQTDLSMKKGDYANNPVTQVMVNNLARGKFWAMLLAVFSYSTAVLTAISALVTLFIGTKGLILFIPLGIAAFISFKFARFLHQYSSAVKRLMASNDLGDMLEAQEQFTHYIKWVGFFEALWLVLIALGILAAIIAPQLLIQ